MRTIKFMRLALRRKLICFCCASVFLSCASISSSSNSSATVCRFLPMADLFKPSSSIAARFNVTTLLSTSTAIIPLETPERTVSVKAALSSESIFARIKSCFWLSSSSAIWLNERARIPISSFSGPSLTRTVNSPFFIRSVAATKFVIGVTRLLAKRKAIQIAPSSKNNAINTKKIVDLTWKVAIWRLSLKYSAATSLVLSVWCKTFASIDFPTSRYKFS